MSNQTENTDDLVINPNENDQFTNETRINEIANNNTPATNVDKTVEKEQTTKTKTGILWIIIVILLIGGGAFYTYVFHRDFVVRHIPFLQSTEQNKEAALQTDETAKENSTQAVGDENEIDYNNASTNSATENVSDDAVVDAITQSMTKNVQTETNTGFKKPLSRPAWIISVSSVAKESIAIARTKELRATGKTADYYWIPDYVNGGNEYFKVFVGPFSTEDEAQNYLSRHTLTDDAYVLKVK